MTKVTDIMMTVFTGVMETNRLIDEKSIIFQQNVLIYLNLNHFEVIKNMTK